MVKSSRKESFVIRVLVPSNRVSYYLFDYAEKNELCLSLNRRFCSIFSKSMARFETQDLAKDFLETVKQKPFCHYLITKVYEMTR